MGLLLRFVDERLVAEGMGIGADTGIGEGWKGWQA